MKDCLKVFSKSPVFWLVLIIFLHIFLLGKVQFFPFPEQFYYPYLTNEGLIPYSQIHDQHFPGLFFFPVNFGTLGLADENIARIWAYTIIIIIQIWIFIITKNITNDVRKALLANFIFFAWHHFWGGWALWIDSFIPLFLLPAFFLSYKYVISPVKNKRNLFLIGILMSLAILFKPTNIVISLGLLGIIVYFDRKITTLLWFLTGFIPFSIFALLYLISIGAVQSFLYWAVVYNFNIYLKYSNKLPDYPGFFEMIISYSPVLLFFLIKNKKLFLLLTIFILSALVGVSDRWDSIHFQPSLPFLAIGTSIVFIERYKNILIKNYIILYFTFAILLIVNYYNNSLSDDVWFFDKETKNVSEIIKQNTKPKEEVYLFGLSHLIYYLSDTLPAGRILNSPLPWFMIIAEQEEIVNLMESQPRLIVRDRTFSVDGQRIIDYARHLDSYIEENYSVFYKINNVEFMKPKL